MPVFKKIIRNAFANGVGFAVEAITAFCMLPYIIHRIGESAYGIWALTISLTGYMGILNLGLRPAINKYVAQYHVLGQQQKMRDLVQASLFCYLICGAIVLLLSLVMAVYVNILFNIPIDYKAAAPTLILLVGMQVAAGLVAVIYGGVISGLQRYDINNGIEIFVMLSRTSIILIFLGKYPNIYTIAAAHFSTTIIGYIATMIIARNISGIKGITLFKLPPKEILYTIFSFSIISFVIGIVGRIMTYIDSVIIASFLTTTAVTYYTVGSRLVKYSKDLLEVLMNVLAPATSEMDAQHDGNIGNLYFYSAKICSLISYPILSFLIIMGDQFLLLWIGTLYPDSYLVMLLLSIGGIILFPQLSAIPILYGLARHKIIMWLSIIEGFVSVTLSLLLCKYYGVIGVAIGLAFPKALLGGVAYPIYLSRVIHVSLSDLFIKCYMRSIAASFPILIALLFFKYYMKMNTWPVFICQFVICSTIHVFSSWIIGLTTDERKKIIDIIYNSKKS